MRVKCKGYLKHRNNLAPCVAADALCMLILLNICIKFIDDHYVSKLSKSAQSQCS